MRKKKVQQPTEYKKSVIYCGVSAKSQKTDGHGLESQEQRCREHAAKKGYEVVAVFKDDYTGGGDFMKRPAMAKVLKFLDDKIYTPHVVIFDDLKRFDRDSEFHWPLRRALDSRGAKVESPNFNFEDSPNGRFIETVTVAHGQLERELNKVQVIQKQHSRLESGWWPFNYPAALKNIKNDKGKIIEYLRNVEPLSSIYKEAIEKFKDYELNTLEAVQKFILAKYAEHGINRKLSLHGVHRILTEILYCGWLEYVPWEVSRRQAHHQGFITLETYEAVQAKLASRAKPQIRVDKNPDFPLRGSVLCPLCRKPITGSWHKGKMGKRYARYWCKTKGCPLANKTVLRGKIQLEFEALLESLKPKPGVIKCVDAAYAEFWNRRQQLEEVQLKSASKEAEKIQEQINVYKDRIGKAKSEEMIEEYETEITKLLKEKAVLLEQTTIKKYPPEKFGTLRQAVFKVVENPLAIWKTDKYEDKKSLLGMYFQRGIIYNKKSGFGTPDLPLVIKILSDKSVSKKAVVEMPGVKPGSRNFSASNCSQD